MTDTITQRVEAAETTGLTLRALHAANVARQAEWCPDQVPDLSFRGNELAGEVGEACNVIKKLERARHGWAGSRSTTEALAEELADVVICADLCAVTAGIDLDAAVVAKFNATSEKVGLSTRLLTAPVPAQAVGVREALAEARTWVEHSFASLRTLSPVACEPGEALLRKIDAALATSAPVEDDFVNHYRVRAERAEQHIKSMRAALAATAETPEDAIARLEQELGVEGTAAVFRESLRLAKEARAASAPVEAGGGEALKALELARDTLKELAHDVSSCEWLTDPFHADISPLAKIEAAIAGLAAPRTAPAGGGDQPGELRIVFDGPPGPNPGKFVEVENAAGASVSVGRWHERPDGFWELRLPYPSTGTVGLERVRHVKRGTEYEVLGEAEVQVSIGKLRHWKPGEAFGPGTEANIVYDGLKFTVYRCTSTGKLWCRFTDEFRDGRFLTVAGGDSNG